MKTTTQARLKQIMNERNLKQVDILNMSLPHQKKLDIKMSKSHLSQYVNGKSSPDQHKLYLLAVTLGVNEAWLMGYDVEQQRTPDEDKKESSSILSIYNQLNENNQQKVYNYAEQKLKEQDNVTRLPKKENKIETIAAHREGGPLTKEEAKKDTDYINQLFEEHFDE